MNRINVGPNLDSLDVFDQRHAEEIGGLAGAAISVLFIELHGADKGFSGVEGDVTASLGAQPVLDCGE